MRKTCFLLASILVAASASLPVQAQWYGDDRYDDRSDYDGYGYDGYGYNDNGTFRCESRDRRTTRCATRGYRVFLIRQLSDMPCVRGRSWGQDGYGVWVSNGCRAMFRFDDRGNGWGNNGWGNNGWHGNNGYNNGHYGRNDSVRCESRDNRSRTCPISAGRNGNIRLVRQLSDTPCIEGRNWGQSRNGVWVSGGCRAEFVATRGGRGGPRAYLEGNDDISTSGVIGDGHGLSTRGPRSVDAPRGGRQTPPPGVATNGGGQIFVPPGVTTNGGGQTYGPPSEARTTPRPRPISVAQSDNRPPPGPISTSEPAPGVFRTLPAEEAPRQAPEPRAREEAQRETP